jgi:hypothetical protein
MSTNKSIVDEVEATLARALAAVSGLAGAGGITNKIAVTSAGLLG